MDIIFIIFVIYYIWKIANKKSVKTLLYEVCNFQKLSNIEEIESEDDVVYIRADGRGANFLFVVKEISIDVNFLQLQRDENSDLIYSALSSVSVEI